MMTSEIASARGQRLHRKLPEVPVCRPKLVGIGDLFGCRVDTRSDCAGATDFGAGFFGNHPNQENQRFAFRP